MLAPPASHPIAVSVSPARIALVAPASRTIELHNGGTQRIVVEVGRTPERWFSVRPARVVLAAGATARVTLRMSPRGRTRAGDHELLLLLRARPFNPSRIAVRMRLGVRLHVRVPGRLVRRLELGSLRVRHRVLLLAVRNRGNVTEQLRGRVSVTLERNGRPVSRLRPRSPRPIQPESRTILAMPYAGGVRGVVTAVVDVRAAAHRRYRIRL